MLRRFFRWYESQSEVWQFAVRALLTSGPVWPLAYALRHYPPLLMVTGVLVWSVALALAFSFARSVNLARDASMRRAYNKIAEMMPGMTMNTSGITLAPGESLPLDIPLDRLPPEVQLAIRRGKVAVRAEQMETTRDHRGRYTRRFTVFVASTPYCDIHVSWDGTDADLKVVQ